VLILPRFGLRPAGRGGDWFAQITVSGLHWPTVLRVLRSLLILCIFVPGFYAALRSRYWALLMYLWFALFRPQDWIWVDITNLRLSMLLGVVLLVPALLAGRYPNVTHPLSFGLIMFLGSTVLSQLTAIRPDVGWQWVDFSFRLFIACLLLVTLASDAMRLLGVIAVIGGSLGFHAAKAGLAYVLGGGTRFADGLSGAFVDNNGYALGTVMIMPLLLVTAQNVDLVYSGRWLPWVRRAWYAAVPLCMLAVVGTYSRGGFLALAAAMLMFVALQRRRLPAVMAVSTCVFLILLFAPISQEYLDRLQTIRTYDEIGEDSALSRQHFWRVGIQMGLDKPLGVGLRQYEAAYDAYDTTFGRYGQRRAVHSAHVQVFAELGVIGAMVWVGLFAYATVVCLRVRARSRDERLSPAMQRFLFTAANGLLTSMVGFVVGGAFLALALNDVTWLTFALVAALDRVSQSALEPEPVAAVPRLVTAGPPLAFRAVNSYNATQPAWPQGHS
jgi:putative inorganic carbon (HCO3(-)) transporter